MYALPSRSLRPWLEMVPALLLYLFLLLTFYTDLSILMIPTFNDFIVIEIVICRAQYTPLWSCWDQLKDHLSSGMSRLASGARLTTLRVYHNPSNPRQTISATSSLAMTRRTATSRTSAFSLWFDVLTWFIASIGWGAWIWIGRASLVLRNIWSGYRRWATRLRVSTIALILSTSGSGCLKV